MCSWESFQNYFFMISCTELQHSVRVDKRLHTSSQVNSSSHNRDCLNLHISDESFSELHALYILLLTANFQH